MVGQSVAPDWRRRAGSVSLGIRTGLRVQLGNGPAFGGITHVTGTLQDGAAHTLNACVITEAAVVSVLHPCSMQAQRDRARRALPRWRRRQRGRTHLCDGFVGPG